MSVPVLADQDHGGVTRILNLPDASTAQEPATLSQLNSAVEGLAWKDNVRVASTANINLASPGASIDGVSMSTGETFLAKNQTSQPENGLYVWHGAAVPATRRDDASTFAELESAVVTVDEGTSNAATTWRQTQVNGSIGASNVVWATFGTAAAAASETVAGVAEVATQAETDTGADDGRFVTPLKLAAWSGRMRQHAATIGDGSSTQIDVTHNFATRDLEVQVWETSGTFRRVDVEIRLPDTNTVRLVFSSAPASNAYRVVIQAKG